MTRNDLRAATALAAMILTGVWSSGCTTDPERLATVPARVKWFLAEPVADGTFDVPVLMPDKSTLYRQTYALLTDTAILRTHITHSAAPGGAWALIGELSPDARAVLVSHVPNVVGHQLLIYLDGEPTRTVLMTADVEWFPIAYGADASPKSLADIQEVARRMTLEGRIRLPDPVAN